MKKQNFTIKITVAQLPLKKFQPMSEHKIDKKYNKIQLEIVYSRINSYTESKTKKIMFDKSIIHLINP